MSSRFILLLLTASLAAPAAAVAGISHSAASPIAGPEKKIITSADQLPRRSYAIPKLPSELIVAPSQELAPLLEQVDRDLAYDLDTLDIRDRATRAGMLNSRAQIAMQRGDYVAAQAFIRQVRAEQDKAAEKLASGTSTEKILDARIKGGSEDQQRAQFRKALAAAYGAMPWPVVGDVLKGTKASLELMSREMAIGSVKSSLDPAAKNLNLSVPTGMVVAVFSLRNVFEHVLPFRDDAVAVLQELVDRNPSSPPPR